jgi:hypothetical protein
MRRRAARLKRRLPVSAAIGWAFPRISRCPQPLPNRKPKPLAPDLHRGGATPAARLLHSPRRSARLRAPSPRWLKAAQLLRLRIALGSGDDPQPDRELVTAFENPDYSLRLDGLNTNLYERLRALKSMAGHRRPTSTKGVLFQLYLAAGYAQGTDGYGRGTPRPWRKPNLTVLAVTLYRLGALEEALGLFEEPVPKTAIPTLVAEGKCVQRWLQDQVSGT